MINIALWLTPALAASMLVGAALPARAGIYSVPQTARAVASHAHPNSTVLNCLRGRNMPFGADSIGPTEVYTGREMQMMGFTTIPQALAAISPQVGVWPVPQITTRGTALTMAARGQALPCRMVFPRPRSGLQNEKPPGEHDH